MKWLSWFKTYLFAPENSVLPDELRRSRLIALASLILIPVGCVYTAIRWKNFGPSDVTFWFMGLGTLSLVVIFRIVRNTRHYKLAGSLLSIVISLLITLTALFNGGIDAPALIWCSIIPLIAGLTIGSVGSLLSTLYFSFLVGTLFVLKVNNVHLPVELQGKALLVVKLVTIQASLIFISLLAWYYEHNRRKAMKLAQDSLTTLQEANNELMKARDDAQAASRAKSSFLATVSHEVRTPMNGIVGMLTLLEQTPLDAEQQEYAETARKSSAQLLQILHDILDVARVEAGKLRLSNAPFKLSNVVGDVITILKHEAQHKGLVLEWMIAPRTPEHLVGDALRFRQILTNLIINAIKFTNEGSVKVYITHKGTTGGMEWLRLDVEDTGIGINDATREILFLPFCQGDDSTTREYGGTGLGLTITKQLVERMGGEIDVQSEVGEGSLFTVLLPFQAV